MADRFPSPTANICAPEYAADQGNLVIRASRQVEKSTFVSATIIFEACKNAESRILFIAPRRRSVDTFSRDRLIPMIKESPLVRAAVGPPLTHAYYRFRIRRRYERLYIRPAFLTADACRGPW